MNLYLSLKKNHFIRKIYWILSSQFGIDPRNIVRSLIGIPKYVRDYFNFRKVYRGSIELVPCLTDWYEEGGATKSEYFWQDLLVARMIFEANPQKHVDVGSRVDGFVAHVASFREIEVLDIRKITSAVPGIIFKQADLMSENHLIEYCDSLSCLHALEHFGLGRYGDKVDSNGSELGLKNMAMLLKDEGNFYLSIPIGIERVEFNANRIFDPNYILIKARENQLQFISLTVIHSDRNIQKITEISNNFQELALKKYSLGIFCFKKSINRKT